MKPSVPVPERTQIIENCKFVFPDADPRLLFATATIVPNEVTEVRAVIVDAANGFNTLVECTAPINPEYRSTYYSERVYDIARAVELLVHKKLEARDWDAKMGTRKKGRVDEGLDSASLLEWDDVGTTPSSTSRTLGSSGLDDEGEGLELCGPST